MVAYEPARQNWPAVHVVWAEEGVKQTEPAAHMALVVELAGQYWPETQAVHGSLPVLLYVPATHAACALTVRGNSCSSDCVAKKPVVLVLE